MVYSADRTSLQANWDGFNDAESGIDHYNVSVYLSKSVVPIPQATLYSTSTVHGSNNSIDYNNFHWTDGDHVRVQVQGVNGAQQSAQAASGVSVNFLESLTDEFDLWERIMTKCALTSTVGLPAVVVLCQVYGSLSWKVFLWLSGCDLTYMLVMCACPGSTV